jgi:Na+:H+ antiporter, NhaA family
MVRAQRQSRSPIVQLLSPLRDFLATEALGAVLLALGAISALIWANSPWSGSYESFWSSRLAISVGGHTLDLDLRHWINDGLMTIFFFIVGLEIKREVTDGHLSSRRAAVLPAAAAVGGMVVPAALYLLIAGGEAPRGWAVPVATDIALAIGVIAVVGARVPASMRAFLLGLAIVDDIGAIAIIAVFYSTGVTFGWLAAAVVGLGLTAVVRQVGVYATWVYVLLGVGIWFALHEGGIHPTIAGVAMGLLAPSVARLAPELIDVDELADVSDVDAARTTSDLARGSVSVVEWLQHVLHPWTSYVIVPIFALANSGIVITSAALSAAIHSPITWGVLVGLVVGKPLGVVLATRLSIRAGIADPPADSASRHITGVGAAAGIGFTVALFITELAFIDPVQQSNAKIAILVASAFAAAISLVILTLRPSGGGYGRGDE